MILDINSIVLSGEVTWVNKKYASNGNLYIIFALKQRNLEFKDKVVVGKNDDVFFVTCFNEVASKTAGIKVGDVVVVQGRVTPFVPEEGKASFNILAEKVARYGNKSDDNDRNQEQAPG